MLGLWVAVPPARMSTISQEQHVHCMQQSPVVSCCSSQVRCQKDACGCKRCAFGLSIVASSHIGFFFTQASNVILLLLQNSGWPEVVDPLFDHCSIGSTCWFLFPT
ncbi:unnamed protein product [Ostreobium quekettii]|uniref:Uncharacterized protein n=1 Tax=Ostreobium quekettii TaxID=121088 RepID=A0A8S1IYJ4_9CHLO|nr:unnamed protein product [Ostreobium quekettii]